MKNENIKISNAWICQISDESINPIFGDIVIEDGKIASIIEHDSSNHLSASDDNTIDAGGRVVTIPLVNFHDHIYSRLAKGMPISGDMSDFQNILKSLWWKLDLNLDLEMVKASTQMAVLESIRNGVTYIFDHHTSPNNTEGSLSTIADIIGNTGLRGVLCFETSDRNGEESSQASIEENQNFFLNHTSENIKSLFGIHASFTVEDNTLKQVSDFIQNNDVGVHVHLAEDKSDNEMSIKQFGKNPIERFNEFGLLNNKSILTHGIHLTESDYKILKSSGAALAYNLDSNLNNSVGLPNFKMVSESTTVLVGTDGMHANIARSFKQLFLQLRHSGFSFDDAFGFMIRSYFNQHKFAKQFFEDFPSLNVGDRADLIIWDYIPPTPFNNENFWGHYLYGVIERPVKTVIQNGNILMRDFSLVNIDETDIASKIFDQGNKLFNKFGK
ncbi:MAG: amidohydrolase family protein [Melioribacteraceae bacterium]|jgi:putative selenium metabolism protein SsnA|nr:amidohydrolase family protein [Melioribacteraceae bacterium]